MASRINIKNCATFLFRILIFIFLLSTGNMYAQKFVWKGGYFGFFDNREYFNQYVNDQTIFGSRISGAAGFTLNEKNTIMAGVDFLYEFGSKGEVSPPDLIAYYRGAGQKSEVLIGAFPRKNHIEMPLALMTDTFQYYRPNVEGILLSYASDGFSQNAWIDWTGRQSVSKRESFIIGLTGHVNNGLFTWEHHFVMSHLAHSLNDTIDEHIRDNGGYTIMPGMDFSGMTSLDTFSISLGYMGSYDRIRNEYEFRFSHGWIGKIQLLYRKVGLTGTVYKGDGQVITTGDGFYKSDFYARTDAYFKIIAPHIESRVQCSFHFLPGILDLSMSFLLRADIDGIFGNYQSN